MDIKGNMALAMLTVLPFLLEGQAQPHAVTSVGVVDSLAPGVLYIGAIPHTVVRIRSEAAPYWVAVPNTATQVVAIGESLSAHGVLESIGGRRFLNTQKGYLLRSSEKSTAAYMADMMAQAQAQVAASPGIGAVPTTLVLTAAQEGQAAIAEAAEGAKRRTDLLLTLVSLIVALLAFERIQGILARPTRWAWSRLKRRVPPPQDRPS